MKCPFNLKPNVGKTDRIIRIVAGLVFLSLFFVLDGAMRWLGLLAIPMIGSAVMGVCPAYMLIGVSTCGEGEMGACCAHKKKSDQQEGEVERIEENTGDNPPPV